MDNGRDLLVGNSTEGIDFGRIKSEELRDLLVLSLWGHMLGSVQNANCSFFQIPKAWVIDYSFSVDCISYRSDITVLSSVNLYFIFTMILVPHSALWHKFWNIKQFLPQQVVFADDEGSDM